MTGVLGAMAVLEGVGAGVMIVKFFGVLKLV